MPEETKKFLNQLADNGLLFEFMSLRKGYRIRQKIDKENNPFLSKKYTMMKDILHSCCLNDNIQLLPFYTDRDVIQYCKDNNIKIPTDCYLYNIANRKRNNKT